VIDNGLPSLSDAKQFNIVVALPPVIESVVLSQGSFAMTWSAMQGKTYRVQFKSDLGNATWTELPDDVIASGSIAGKTDASSSSTQRYYRVVLVP